MRKISTTDIFENLDSLGLMVSGAGFILESVEGDIAKAGPKIINLSGEGDIKKLLSQFDSPATATIESEEIKMAENEQVKRLPPEMKEVAEAYFATRKRWEKYTDGKISESVSKGEEIHKQIVESIQKLEDEISALNGMKAKIEDDLNLTLTEAKKQTKKEITAATKMLNEIDMLKQLKELQKDCADRKEEIRELNEAKETVKREFDEALEEAMKKMNGEITTATARLNKLKKLFQGADF